MPDSSYDRIVIGAGNAAFGAAGVAHEAGWRVLVVEGRDVGGTCPLRGCVPKKVLVAAAEVLDQISRAPAHGISVSSPELDWKKLIERKQTFVEGVPADFEQSLANRDTFALAIKHGLTAEDLGSMVYAYPTFNSDLRFLV
ncbi:MAG: FAD-dependent oxidoreductase [Myxococcota bacterium]